MYCTQCGTLASNDAKFCANCGSELNEATPERHAESSALPVIVLRKPALLWLYLAAVPLVGTYAAIFIPAFAGRNVNSLSVFASMLWTGLFFYLWWKRRGRKGWRGALSGMAVGVIVCFSAAAISGFVRGASGL